jgi:diacylglycerol kinase (ATP)
MQTNQPGEPRTWTRKFGDAFRGIKVGACRQSSFRVHIFAAAAVVVAAGLLRCDWREWCLLALCIAIVLTAEMFNSALESLAKAVRRDRDPDLANALDIGSAAVLLASVGAAVVGAIVFGQRLAVLLNWW